MRTCVFWSKWKSVLALIWIGACKPPHCTYAQFKALFLATQNGSVASRCFSTIHFTCKPPPSQTRCLMCGRLWSEQYLSTIHHVKMCIRFVDYCVPTVEPLWCRTLGKCSPAWFIVHKGFMKLIVQVLASYKDFHQVKEGWTWAGVKFLFCYDLLCHMSHVYLHYLFSFLLL